MANSSSQPYRPAMPRRSRQRTPLIWLVPAVAIFIGLFLLVQNWVNTGPSITITFQTATGLEVNKTPVKYKDVVVGIVSDIALTEDGTQVLVTVSLSRRAKGLAREDSRFWVVRPRIGPGGISGVDTLISGAFIDVDRGTSTRFSQTFVALESPPAVLHGVPGRAFLLHTADLGSINIGSPVFYRRVAVGTVISYRLKDNGDGIDIQVFIDAPYDKLVTGSTRFWNAGGVDISLNADGVKMHTQALASLISGGIAFETIGQEDGPPPNSYELASDYDSAVASTLGPAHHFELRFDDAPRGLAKGVPVEFLGQNVGKVTSVDFDYEAGDHKFTLIAGVDIFPRKMGGALSKLPQDPDGSERRTAEFLQRMVASGLRARTKVVNLLTGQLAISLEFVPQAPPTRFDVQARPLTLPTIRDGGLDEIQTRLAAILGKIEKMPLESIGSKLDSVLNGLNGTVATVNKRLLPEAARTFEQGSRAIEMVQASVDGQGQLQHNLNQTLVEVQRASRSVKELAETINRHPESLLWGR